MTKSKNLRNKKCISFQEWSHSLYKQKTEFKIIKAKRFTLILRKSRNMRKKVRQNNKEDYNVNNGLSMNRAY